MKYKECVVRGFIAGALLLAATQSSALRIHHRAGTTSAAFLKMGVGARAIGMGEAYTAEASGPEALYWNPAGVAHAARKELTAMHHLSFQSINHSFAGYIRPLGERGGFGLIGTALFVPSDIERRSGAAENISLGDDFTSSEGSFGANDLSLGVAYGNRITDGFSIGVVAKYIRQSIDNESGTTLALDAGALFTTSIKGLRFGVSLLNLGPGVKFSQTFDLPLTMRAGMRYSNLFAGKFTLSTDISKTLDNYPFVSVGAEYRLLKNLTIRSGYRYRWFGNTLGGFSGFRAGGGLSIAGVRMDYAFSPFGDLGTSHRISLNLRFGEIQEPKPRVKEKKVVPAPPLPQAPQKQTIVLPPPPPVPQKQYLDIPLQELSAQVLLHRLSVKGGHYIVSASTQGKVLTSMGLRVLGVGLEDAKILYGEANTIPDPKDLPGGSPMLRAFVLESEPKLPVRSGTLVFSVPKEWMTANKISPEQVTLLYRGSQGRWVHLKTDAQAATAEQQLFKAHIFDLGTFAVLGIK